MSPRQRRRKQKRLEAALGNFFLSLVLALLVFPLYLPHPLHPLFLFRDVRIKMCPGEMSSARVEAALLYKQKKFCSVLDRRSPVSQHQGVEYLERFFLTIRELFNISIIYLTQFYGCSLSQNN